MAPLEMTPATVVVLLLVLLGMVLAIRRMAKRGLCDCKGCGDECSRKGSCSCAAADRMVADMKKRAEEAQQ